MDTTVRTMPSKVIRMTWVLPLFMSAVFFISGLFAVLSPFPIISAHYLKGRWFAFFAAAVNFTLVSLLEGREAAAIFAVFGLTIGLVLPEFLNRLKNITRSGFLTFTVVAALSVATLFVAQTKFHTNLMGNFKSQVSVILNEIGQNQGGLTGAGLSDEAETQEFKDKVITELPSALGIVVLLSIWMNLLILLRMNPGNVKERLGLDPLFFSKWKSSEWLIWPTIIFGYALVFEKGLSHSFAMNGFKFLMCIYAIQGVGVLSYVFDKWGVIGFLRTFLFTFLVVFMLPLVLSVGFFDQWFDFRAKVGQS